jgi:hypothetical protein
MKAAWVNLFLALIAPILTVGGTAEKSRHGSANTGGTETAAAPTADALLALEKQANAAYFASDSQFFEGILSDKFTMREAGRQMDKAAALKWIAANRCKVKDWKLDDPRMARIDADTYVLSYRGTFDGSCADRDGNSVKIPSPVRAATVWFRAGDTWRAAFHGQNSIPNPQNPASPAVAGDQNEAKKADRAAANAKVAAAPGTAAMMAVEKNVWEAWMEKDAKKLVELTTADLSFQNIYGDYFANKADTLKNWTSAYCNIKRVSVADGQGALLSATVGILNRTGTAEGTCNGQNVPPVPIYGTSVFVKEGGSWKLAFSLNRLD